MNEHRDDEKTGTRKSAFGVYRPAIVLEQLIPVMISSVFPRWRQDGKVHRRRDPDELRRSVDQLPCVVQMQ